MASALGGLVDAYVDSDEGEGEEVAQGELIPLLACAAQALRYCMHPPAAGKLRCQAICCIRMPTANLCK